MGCGGGGTATKTADARKISPEDEEAILYAEGTLAERRELLERFRALARAQAELYTEQHMETASHAALLQLTSSECPGALVPALAAVQEEACAALARQPRTRAQDARLLAQTRLLAGCDPAPALEDPYARRRFGLAAPCGRPLARAEMEALAAPAALEGGGGPLAEALRAYADGLPAGAADAALLRGAAAAFAAGPGAAELARLRAANERLLALLDVPPVAEAASEPAARDYYEQYYAPRRGGSPPRGGSGAVRERPE